MQLKDVHLAIMVWFLDWQDRTRHDVDTDKTRAPKDKKALLNMLDTMLPYTSMFVTLAMVLGMILCFFVFVNLLFFLVFTFLVK